MKAERVLPPTYLLVFILIIVAVDLLFPLADVIGFPWKLLGMIPFALGIVINVIADSAFKKLGTTVKPLEESTALVTNGVFRLSRNPMYLGFVLILIGVAIFMGSLTPYGVIVVFAVVMDIVFIKPEEKMLEEKFGEVWLEYRRQVRRWI